MKVVSFRSYYHPEIAASMYLMQNLAEDMTKEGVNVELFVPTPSRGISKEIRKKYKKINYEKHYNGMLEVHRFSMLPEGTNTIGRALRYGLLNLVFLWKGLTSDADVFFIDSTPPTQGVIASILKKIKKKPIIYNLQDIFPDSLVNTGISTENSLAFKIGKWMERVTYRNADKIIAISEDFKANIMAKGVPEKKIVVVYNWVDEQAVHHVERKDNTLFDEYNLDRNKFYIAYSGNIGFTQNMKHLLDVAEKSGTYENIGFILVGDGAYKEELVKEIEKRQLKNITLIPFQPYERISEVFSLGDVGLIISKAGVGNNSVPSKTWSYMAAETPILASFDEDSELTRVVEKTGCGCCSVPDDAAGFVNRINQLMGLKGEELAKMGKNGRDYIDQYLSRNIGTAKYIETMKNVYEEYVKRK